jgi:hypothetical protein
VSKSEEIEKVYVSLNRAIHGLMKLGIDVVVQITGMEIEGEEVQYPVSHCTRHLANNQGTVIIVGKGND